MAGHRDTTVAITTDAEAKGLVIDEALIESIWPGAEPQEVAAGVRDILELMLVITHQSRNGGLLSSSEQYVKQNSTPTD